MSAEQLMLISQKNFIVLKINICHLITEFLALLCFSIVTCEIYQYKRVKIIVLKEKFRLCAGLNRAFIELKPSEIEYKVMFPKPNLCGTMHHR